MLLVEWPTRLFRSPTGLPDELSTLSLLTKFGSEFSAVASDILPIRRGIATSGCVSPIADPPDNCGAVSTLLNSELPTTVTFISLVAFASATWSISDTYVIMRGTLNRWPFLVRRRRAGVYATTVSRLIIFFGVATMLDY